MPKLHLHDQTVIELHYVIVNPEIRKCTRLVCRQQPININAWKSVTTNYCAERKC